MCFFSERKALHFLKKVFSLKGIFWYVCYVMCLNKEIAINFVEGGEVANKTQFANKSLCESKNKWINENKLCVYFQIQYPFFLVVLF